mmetsp:Transcript_28509/g.66224  ORF Transcript_28509/g.66224 Transcript_28509/m.66224 type:complete len:206 (-) Transcript_28509:619-1236(-)
MAFQTPRKRVVKTRYGHLRPNLQRNVVSPSWKETLKQSCIERARRKRNELLHAKRSADPVVRMLVEEELEECGVSVVSEIPNSQTTTDSTGADVIPDEFAISEDEMYALMQEVEDELQRNEDRSQEELDAILSFKQWDEQYKFEELAAQIAEYEEWEAGIGNVNSSEYDLGKISNEHCSNGRQQEEGQLMFTEEHFLESVPESGS